LILSPRDDFIDDSASKDTNSQTLNNNCFGI